MGQHKIICLNVIAAMFSATTSLFLKDFVGMFPKAVFVMFINVEEEIQKGSAILQITSGSVACVRVNVCVFQNLPFCQPKTSNYYTSLLCVISKFVK